MFLQFSFQTEHQRSSEFAEVFPVSLRQSFTLKGKPLFSGRSVWSDAGIFSDIKPEITVAGGMLDTITDVRERPSSI